MTGIQALAGGPTGQLADTIDFLQTHLPWLAARAEEVPAEPLCMAVTDELCMARYQNGDAQAFRMLYRRYSDKLYRYALRLGTQPSEAEEIFQEVWLAVIRGKEGYRTNASFASWLFSIAHRRVADRWRTLGRHAPDSLHTAHEDEIEHFQQTAATNFLTPEGSTQNAALGQALLDAVQKLPLPQREAFLMKAEGDLSLEDIARATGVPRETVKSRLRYAQQHLREMLEGWR